MNNTTNGFSDTFGIPTRKDDTVLPDPDRGDVCYFYHRDSRYSVTVAYQRRNDNSVAYGAAFCRPEDKFVKRRGRQIALGRMQNHTSVIQDPGSTRWQVHESILSHFTGEFVANYVPNNFRFE